MLKQTSQLQENACLHADSSNNAKIIVTLYEQSISEKENRIKFFTNKGCKQILADNISSNEFIIEGSEAKIEELCKLYISKIKNERIFIKYITVSRSILVAPAENMEERIITLDKKAIDQKNEHIQFLIGKGLQYVERENLPINQFSVKGGRYAIDIILQEYHKKYNQELTSSSCSCKIF